MAAAPLTPEPWEGEGPALTQAAEESVLCHRCLVTNDPSADFCENCGASIGTYTNYLPFPYLFSVGHTFRAGTSGDYKRSPLTVIGFVLLALAEYTLFCPIYLYQFFRGPKKAHSDS